jgi:hypothetical protein
MLAGMLITVDSRTATRFLRIYGIETPVAEARVSRDSQEIALTVDGVTDAQLGAVIRVKGGKTRAVRACPLSEPDASELADELQASGAVPGGDEVAHTVSDVVLRCAKMFAESGIAELHLLIYLTRLGYRTHAVYMRRPRVAYAKKTASL